ncbi:MAG: PAS domain S-box protein, partial [Phycisphaerae bacterium]|nr:PAS domain S-box protein [Phycisphaerae bacterium]
SSQITEDTRRSARLNRMVDWGLMLGIIGGLGVLGALLARNIIQFVGDLRETQRKLEESRTILMATLESSSDGVLVVTGDQVVSHCNSRFREIWSVPPDVVSGGDNRQLIRNAMSKLDNPEGFDTRISEINQASAPSEDTLRLKDGRLLERYSYPLNLAGCHSGRVWLFRDVTERRQAEEAVRESHRMLTTLVDNLPGFVYRCRNDRDWTMEYLSGRFQETTGYAPEDLINNRRLSFNDLIIEEQRERLWEFWQQQLSKREPVQVEYTINAGDGTTRWLWEQGRGVFGDDGELLALEGFICDITDRKQAEIEREKLETQLRHSQKMEAVGQLAGGVAHDFNNILTAIFGNVELAIAELESHYPAASGILDGMHQIERSAKRASTLARQLLAFSRRQVVRPEVLDLNATLSDLEKMLNRLITEDIHLELILDADPATVRTDPGQLEQVVMNLVVNARDAMPSGGTLAIETSNVYLDESYAATRLDAQVGEHVLLSVSDTGAGMDATTLERVFEPFFTTKPMGQGTGLGLSTAYGIVKQARGHIAAYSEAGRGTTFRVYLPLEHGQAPAPSVARVRQTAPVGTETIIICEDDVAVRKLTVHVLEDAGYKVLESGKAEEALRIATDYDGPIHMLLTDVIMPDMNGRKLADTLCAIRPEARTLFVSGYTANVIVHHGVLDSGVDFMEKPYSRQQLLQRVREILDRR